MNTKNKKQTRYEDILYNELQDPKEACAYLSACLNDEDPRVFLLALKDVIEARKLNITQLAEKTGINRQHLYRLFSNEGNPTWSNILAVLKELNIDLIATQPNS